MRKVEEYSESQLEDLFDSIDPEDESTEARRAYAGVASRLGFRTRRNSFRMVARNVAAVMAAAVVAVALFVGGAAYQSVESGKTVWSEIFVPEGEYRDIELSDGTCLHLKPGSRVTYPSAFSAGCRQIFLDGEVLAEVSKNPHKPFVITSGDVSVRVLGTVFDFRAYSSSGSTEIALAEGSVEMLVASDSSSVKYSMVPGDVLQYDGHTGSVSRRHFSPEVIGQMTTVGSLHFVDQRLDDIVADLERIFGRKIVVADEGLSARRFDAWFAGGDDLDMILASLNADGAMRISERNGVLYIFSR